ncbi:MAG: hypothetical protein FWD93_04280 [Coriobacteriia bacterium]|nr:hypothetical protein [Coriobacteriia bacterium]
MNYTIDYNFDTRRQYIAFLEKLAEYCDTVAVLAGSDAFLPNFFMQQEPEVRRMREFPGYAKHWKKFDVPFYSLDKKATSVLKEYCSFLDIGHETYGDNAGYDMAFYREGDLVFYVIWHENMSLLCEKHRPHFASTIEQYQISEFR